MIRSFVTNILYIMVCVCVQQVQCFQEHQQNVADVDWSSDGAHLLSGGFDHCVKDWDVVAGKSVHSYSELQGFIQTVRFNPAGQ
jgi:WD40 repeat protein